MISQILRTVLGVIIFICSTPQGMATEFIPEEVRADFFCASTEMSEEVSSADADEVLTADLDEELIPASDFDESERRAKFSLNDAALLPVAETTLESETSVEEGKEESRNQKRQLSLGKFSQKCRFSNSLSPETMAKGVARHPLTQDARQERTAAIRFLQVSALDC